MSKKYEFVKGDTLTLAGVTLIRIRAVRDIPWHYVKAGDLGGYIEKERNLSHDDLSWVDFHSRVIGKHSTLRNSTLRNSTVERSTVLDNTLLDSRVERSTVLDSVVEHSKVRDSTVEHSTLRNSTVDHSTLRNGVVQDSFVRDSKVRDSTVECGTVERSTVECGTVRNSEVLSTALIKREAIEFIKKRASAWKKEGV